MKKKRYAFFKNYIIQCFSFADTAGKLKLHLESYQKDEQKSAKQKHFDWANELYKELEASKIVADKFINQLSIIFQTNAPDYKQQLLDRVTAAQSHFSPILKGFSKKVLAQLEKLKDEKRIKTYLQELTELDALFFKQLQLIQKAQAMVLSVNNNTEFSKETIHTSKENQGKVCNRSRCYPF